MLSYMIHLVESRGSCWSLRTSRAFLGTWIWNEFLEWNFLYGDLVTCRQCSPKHPCGQCSSRFHNGQPDTGRWNGIPMFQSFTFPFSGLSQTQKLQVSYNGIFQTRWYHLVSTVVNSLARVLTSRMFRHLMINSPFVVWNQANPWWTLKLARRVL